MVGVVHSRLHTSKLPSGAKRLGCGRQGERLRRAVLRTSDKPCATPNKPIQKSCKSKPMYRTVYVRQNLQYPDDTGTHLTCKISLTSTTDQPSAVAGRWKGGVCSFAQPRPHSGSAGALWRSMNKRQRESGLRRECASAHARTRAHEFALVSTHANRTCTQTARARSRSRTRTRRHTRRRTQVRTH